MARMAGEILFVDTNVLLSATDTLRQRHRDACRLFAESASWGIHLAASGQILREYLAVATRPADANGLGLQVGEATANVRQFLRFIHLYDETRAVAARLCELGLSRGLRGKRFHDANIVATMATHGIRALVTEDADHFATFDEIETVALADVAAWRG